ADRQSLAGAMEDSDAPRRASGECLRDRGCEGFGRIPTLGPRRTTCRAYRGGHDKNLKESFHDCSPLVLVSRSSTMSQLIAASRLKRWFARVAVRAACEDRLPARLLHVLPRASRRLFKRPVNHKACSVFAVVVNDLQS